MKPTLLDAAIKAKNKSLKPSFLQDWTPDQFKKMQKAICRHFSKNEIITHKQTFPAKYRTFDQLGDIIGFAYTSSSSYAGYWVCNAEISHKLHSEYKYIGFAMGEDLKGYAVLWDKDENEIIISI